MNNVIITLRTNEEIKKKLDMLALKENRSLNNYIMTILIKHIEEQEKKTTLSRGGLFCAYIFI